MSLYKTISIGGGLIGICQLNESINNLLPEFSKDELSDPLFARYTHDKRKLEWLATRLLLKEMIGNKFSLSYLASGKPLLVHETFKKISITHSRNFVAVIVHESENVGIDIEDTTRNFQRVEQRFLSAEELGFVQENQLLKCLFWCAKEAIFKLVDEEGIEFREQIIVTADPENENQFLARYITTRKKVTYSLNYEFFAGNCLVWVVNR